MHELCPVHINLQKASAAKFENVMKSPTKKKKKKASAEDINWKRMKEKEDIGLSCSLRKVYPLYKKMQKTVT